MPIDPGPCVWELPDPAQAPAGEDVITVGADLAPSTVLAAYRQGLFPMHLATGELGWWSPDPRGVLPLDGMRVTRSLRASLRRFEFTVDGAFAEVMEACRAGRADGAWITDDFLATYTHLHELGWAHSVEVWREGELVGGLYGIEVGGLFAGESMFHRVRDASKAALAVLVEQLVVAEGADGRLLDVQWRTDHLTSLGVVEIPRADYLARLETALALPAVLGPSTPITGGRTVPRPEPPEARGRIR
jgi:leucyl/phenylalanyl-tRNA---protein transferase